jgi:subtilase family serine protease
MFPAPLPRIHQRRSHTFRHGPANARRPRRLAFRPVLLLLEQRVALTGNIGITDAFLVNASDQPLTGISAGQHVYVHADFATENLPSSASYCIGYTVNGLTMDTGHIRLGAGVQGTSPSYYYYWGYFVASPGANQVTVTVDPDESVPETTYADNTMSFGFNAASAAIGPLSYTVSQIRAAYGVGNIPDLGPAAADGAGQTIALVDGFNDPSIITDLDGFDEAMHLTTNSSPTLYQQYGCAKDVLSIYNQYGKNITAEVAGHGHDRKGVPRRDPRRTNWQLEETLDVEWAHAIAPGAHIDLIECGGSGTHLFRGAATAARLPAVSVVSMSWSFGEDTSRGVDKSNERHDDSSIFVTPRNHRGVTFLASTGDTGAPGGYPALSPNVVAVGGTQLNLQSNAYDGETGWSFPTPTVLDDHGASYTQNGHWSPHDGGFGGIFSTAPGRSKSSATWTTVIGKQDRGHENDVEVSATWVVAATNATHAAYRIYNGTGRSRTLLGTVRVNQSKSPVGIPAGEAQFQELGAYDPRGRKVTVVLSANSGNGSVVADAVGIAPALSTGGGQSRYESEPSYQRQVQRTGHRATPDVSFDGSNESGVICYQNGGLHFDYYGTSLATPCWAGLIAIANQGRVARGGKTFNSGADPMQTLQALYSLPASDFHQIATGYNGITATAGYNEVTGLGSPIAYLLVPDLASYDLPRKLGRT